jgi:hypothetical protein
LVEHRSKIAAKIPIADDFDKDLSIQTCVNYIVQFTKGQEDIIRLGQDSSTGIDQLVYSWEEKDKKVEDILGFRSILCTAGIVVSDFLYKYSKAGIA